MAGAQHNLGFESLAAGAGVPLGWSAADGGAGVTSDDDVAAEGERSLRVARAGAAGVTRVTQRVPVARLRTAGERQGTARVRLSGAVRVDAMQAASPALWLRVDGPRGPLFLDSYGYGREASPEPELIASAREGDGGWHRYELELPLPRDVDEVAFGVSVRGQGTAWFDALELTTVVTDSFAAATPAAARYVRAALAIMREHSVNRQSIDWSALEAEALAHARGAATSADAHLAVRFAARELGDRHSYLQSAGVTAALRTAAVSNARTGSPPAPPRGRRLEHGAGYVFVPGFAGGTPAEQLEFAESLSNVVRALDSEGRCGWVVDLRQNTGGNLWPMLAGLGPLLGEGELAASVYPDGRRVPVWHRDGQAGFGDYVQLRVRSPYRVRAKRPVAVLLGPRTASSAEVLAVAFQGRPATRSFGAQTRGLSAGNRTFALADGASLVLTVAATSDRAGRVLAGPVVPDEAVARAPDASGTDAALEAAVAWLTAGDSCG
jgi:hypothetical protein